MAVYTIYEREDPSIFVTTSDVTADQARLIVKALKANGAFVRPCAIERVEGHNHFDVDESSIVWEE